MTDHSPLEHATRALRTGLIDSITTVGGVATGAALGSWTHHRARALPRSARLAAGIITGLTAALITDSLITAAAAPVRRDLHRPAPRLPDPRHGNGPRAQAALAAAAEAESNAAFNWAMGDLTEMRERTRWSGYEDGTAVYYLGSGQYLRYQPSHRQLGTDQSLGWEQQYTFETVAGSDPVISAAHLVDLMDQFKAGPPHTWDKPLTDEEVDAVIRPRPEASDASA
ncbi:hypothetical protein ACGFYY_32735 [Streptomyces sp. NPDC048331]|uniref:hypothetical protein n=1 Tax=Streptomyces sp. NPDC048331 TaxID=3365534 RepID=UPI003710F2C8